MKKLLLSLLMMAGVSAFAQKDIAVELVNPAAGSTITSKQAFNFDVKLTNAGTVALTDQDTVIVLFVINNNILTDGQGRPIGIVSRTAMAVGETKTVSLNNISLTINSEGNANVCAVSSLSSDNNNANNAGCSAVQFKFATALSEIEAAANTVNVFPNPVNDVLNFSIDYSKATNVSVMDMTGRLIENVNFEMNSARVDVRNYNKGVYLYQITNSAGEVVKAGKFTVN